MPYGQKVETVIQTQDDNTCIFFAKPTVLMDGIIFGLTYFFLIEAHET